MRSYLLSMLQRSCRDANSRNGTKVGDKKLEAGNPVELRDGDTIHAAQVTFTYCSSRRLFERLSAR
jgi:pSer/pThr/pTyr-binding forkhead associated (FHA) protein